MLSILTHQFAIFRAICCCSKMQKAKCCCSHAGDTDSFRTPGFTPGFLGPRMSIVAACFNWYYIDISSVLSLQTLARKKKYSDSALCQPGGMRLGVFHIIDFLKPLRCREFYEG